MSSRSGVWATAPKLSEAAASSASWNRARADLETDPTAHDEHLGTRAQSNCADAYSCATTLQLGDNASLLPRILALSCVASLQSAHPELKSLSAVSCVIHELQVTASLANLHDDESKPIPSLCCY